MKSVYVPYHGGKPAALSINGHRVVLMFHDQAAVEDEMDLLGADRIRRIEIGGDAKEEAKTLGRIAASAKGGVVVIPPEAPVREVIRTLEADLPWIQ